MLDLLIFPLCLLQLISLSNIKPLPTCGLSETQFAKIPDLRFRQTRTWFVWNAISDLFRICVSDKPCLSETQIVWNATLPKKISPAGIRTWDLQIHSSALILWAKVTLLFKCLKIILLLQKSRRRPWTSIGQPLVFWLWWHNIFSLCLVFSHGRDRSMCLQSRKFRVGSSRGSSRDWL